MNRKQKTQIWKAYNEETRKLEEIDINEAELVPGQQIHLLFWCESDQRYVSVPGTSRHTVTSDFNLKLVQS